MCTAAQWEGVRGVKRVPRGSALGQDLPPDVRSPGGLGWKGQQNRRRRGKRSLTSSWGLAVGLSSPCSWTGPGALPRQPFSGHLLCARGWDIFPVTGRGRRSSWLAVGSEGRLASAPLQKRNDPLALFSVLFWGVTRVPGASWEAGPAAEPVCRICGPGPCPSRLGLGWAMMPEGSWAGQVEGIS